ncbi:hypothetical protein IWW50_002669 [Coemansia erecta]|nr:hypothetical protein IWW50_002669 [Coemansia erecta]
MIPETPPDQAPPLYPAPMGEEHIEKPDYPSLTLLKPQQGNARPWWARLLVDSMLVPFVQGFMLNLGIHWVRYWRRGGGLVGVFRGRFGPRKSAP